MEFRTNNQQLKNLVKENKLAWTRISKLKKQKNTLENIVNEKKSIIKKNQLLNTIIYSILIGTMYSMYTFNKLNICYQ
jgi:hypothetical protein